MNRLITLPMAAVSMFGFAASLPASAGQETLKQQLVGTWSLVSWKEVLPDGTKIASLGDANVKGRLMFDATGHVSFQVIAELPKLKSNDRKKTSSEENKALAQGSSPISVRIRSARRITTSSFTSRAAHSPT